MQLTVLDHRITAEQAFGSSSVLVEPSLDGSALDVALFGAPFQLLSLAVGLIYIVFVARYWDFLRYFIVSAVGIHLPRREKAHINPAEQQNIEMVMIVLGVLLLALVAVKVCGVWYSHLLTGIDSDAVVWIVGSLVTGAVGVMLLVQYSLTKLVAVLCERGDIGRGIVDTKMLYLAVGFVTVIPFGLLFLLSTEPLSTVGFWGGVLCMSISVIIFVKESFLFFVSQKISILHWILYLCALEIIPVSLILAPIVR